MITVLQILTGIVLLQLLFALWNASRLPVLGSDQIQGGPADDNRQPVQRLSVLIPARDEAGNIAECLAAVLDCRTAGEEVEILILDDQSRDGTGSIAAAIGGERTLVLQGRELPEGWLGKCHACAQLAEAAAGDWLLFLDADIRLKPGALEAALASAQAQGKGLITGFPRQLTGSWLERLVVPLMSFTIISHLPVPLVRSSGDPRFVAAHGGFMLIHRESYARCGGHAGIRDQLVDDMALARAVKLAGEPVTLADITGHADMRMYHNAREVWNGYRKNIYAGLGRRPWLLLAVLLFYTAVYVLPVVSAIASGITGEMTALLWSVAAICTGFAVKRTADAAGRQPVWFCLLLPAGIMCLIAISAASWRGSKSQEGYEWKGRHYR